MIVPKGTKSKPTLSNKHKKKAIWSELPPPPTSPPLSARPEWRRGVGQNDLAASSLPVCGYSRPVERRTGRGLKRVKSAPYYSTVYRHYTAHCLIDRHTRPRHRHCQPAAPLLLSGHQFCSLLFFRSTNAMVKWRGTRLGTGTG